MCRVIFVSLSMVINEKRNKAQTNWETPKRKKKYHQINAEIKCAATELSGVNLFSQSDQGLWKTLNFHLALQHPVLDWFLFTEHIRLLNRKKAHLLNYVLKYTYVPWTFTVWERYFKAIRMNVVDMVFEK